MNPNDKPTTPSDAAKPSTPEEDATLQAIESLDSESTPSTTTPPASSSNTGLNPTPDASFGGGTSTPSTSTPDPFKPMSTPFSPTDSTPATPPVGDAASSDTSATPPVAPASTDSSPLTSAASSTPESPKPDFKPFEGQKKSKKSLIILIVVLVVLILGVGGYFGWQYLQSQNTPATVQPQTDTSNGTVDETPLGTEAEVTTEITDMQADLDNADEAPYADTTLSDSTLNN